MRAPSIRISDSARNAFLNAMQAADGDSLRLAINPRFEPDLFFAQKEAGDMAVDCDGITIVLDPPSAVRADGVFIDFVDGPNGSGFKIDNPNKPVARKEVQLTRDCDATLIPSGDKMRLSQGERVVVTQALGGSFTVQTGAGHLARITGADADSLGLEATPTSNQPSADGPFSMNRVMDMLKTVFDPEIPVNVVDLGLIYACDAHELPAGGHRIEIKMSMTAPGCGMGDVLKEDARARVLTVPDVSEVDVEIVWDPPWDQTRMSEAARLQLGMF